jgi:hypothetical protein
VRGEGEGRERNRGKGRGDFAGDIKGGKISLTQINSSTPNICLFLGVKLFYYFANVEVLLHI